MSGNRSHSEKEDGEDRQSGLRPVRYILQKADGTGRSVNGMTGKKKIDLNHLTEDEVLKYEIAGELGLLDRVLEDGWRSLTAKETGRIGGLVTRRKREMAKESSSSDGKKTEEKSSEE